MQDSNSVQTDAAGPEPVEIRLRSAREAANISVDEVADALRLERNIILAIEEGDFEALGAPVFVKGHLRSYARLLGLPEAEITSAYQVKDPEPEEFRTLSAPTTMRSGANLSSFVLWVLLSIIVLAGLIYMLLGDDESEPSEFVTPGPDEEVVIPAPQPEPVVDPVIRQSAVEAEPEPEEEDRPQPKTIDKEPDSGAVAVKDESVMPPAEAAADAPDRLETAEAAAVEESPAVDQAPVSPAAEPQALQAAGPVSLQLIFSDECWVEISDSQRRLLYGLEKAGNNRQLKGTPPFRLFLGNTNAVTIKVAGQDYEVPSSVRTGSNTARFTIDSAAIAGMKNQ